MLPSERLSSFTQAILSASAENEAIQALRAWAGQPESTRQSHSLTRPGRQHRKPHGPTTQRTERAKLEEEGIGRPYHEG